MNTESHILMGKFLCGYVGSHYGISLNQRSFVLGNVLPDYCPSFLTSPHYLKNNSSYVQHVIRAVTPLTSFACNDKKRSRLLGILCHFYADFFCFAHNSGFTGGLYEHIAYEKELYHFFRENFQQIVPIRFVSRPIPGARPEEIYRQFESLHSSYLLSRPSLGNDLLYAMMACIDAIVLTCGCTAAEITQTNLHQSHKLQVV